MPLFIPFCVAAHCSSSFSNISIRRCPRSAKPVIVSRLYCAPYFSLWIKAHLELHRRLHHVVVRRSLHVHKPYSNRLPAFYKTGHIFTVVLALLGVAKKLTFDYDSKLSLPTHVAPVL